jgi:hypothetical protein
MQCRLKMIAGSEGDREFALAGGESFLGRSQRCVVRLGSASVSYEHAVITREGNDYYIENLSANGTTVNGERIGAKTRLRLRDQIRLGPDVTVRVEALPASGTGGSPRKGLVILVALMLVAGVVLIALDPFSGEGGTNWPRAYGELQTFVQNNAGSEVPAETDRMLREAWRLEVARDRAAASQAWVRLHVLLSGSEGQFKLEHAAGRQPRALGRLLDAKPGAAFDADFYKAALLQFVVQMERRK